MRHGSGLKLGLSSQHPIQHTKTLLPSVEQPASTQRGSYPIMIDTNKSKSEKIVIQFGAGTIALLVALALLALAPLSLLAQQKPTIAGDYAGTLGPLHVMLHLQVDAAGRVTGTLDSPDRGAIGIHCSNFRVDGESLTFSVPAVGGTWKGTVTADGTLSGTWDQGNSLPLNFARDTAALAEKASRTGETL